MVAMSHKSYIVNKRAKGQPRFFKCVCCGKEFDFNDSVDYIGAVMQWEGGGGKCYACANGYCHCKEDKKEKTVSHK